MSTHDTMLAALKAAEPVLADIDRHLRAKHPGMQTLEALDTVRGAIAAKPEAVATKPANAWAYPKYSYSMPVLFNPYTGEPRDARDIQSDPHGVLLVPPGKAIPFAAAHPSAASYAERKTVTLMVDAAMVEMKNITPPLRRSECERLIRAAISAPTEQRPQNCGTGFCSCIECPYHDQPRATSCGCSK